MTVTSHCGRTPALIAILLWVAASINATAQTSLAPMMPLPEDHSSTWWAEGFPEVVPGAPWHRVIQTGHYAFVLDTENLTVPHSGPLPNRDATWKSLPPAELNLTIDVDGKSYRCTGSKGCSRYAGPRLIESGRFFQRADVTDLVFQSGDGEILNVDARFETAAWPDRLGLILNAQPGEQAIQAGETSFGKIGGGFGLTGSNAYEVPHSPELDPETFSLEFRAFVPADYRVSKRVSPWLVCKNHNEARDGNYGILIVGDVAQARMNIGGGKQGQFRTGSKKVKLNAWNHFALSYDGDSLRLFLNGQLSGETKIGKPRTPGNGPLVFGRRADNFGDGYPFRGVIDEIRCYDRALTTAQIRQRFHHPENEYPSVWMESFHKDGTASETRPREVWNERKLSIKFTTGQNTFQHQAETSRIALAIDPISGQMIKNTSALTVSAEDRPVDFDIGTGWHRINLDGIEPINSTAPRETSGAANDAIERIPFTLANPGDDDQIARLMFEKTARGFRQRIGTPITGISAILRDASGQPTGIPVQLSKNWHNDPEGGVYAEAWFHGLTQIRLPARSTLDLELVIAYGHWGGVPAASHAQLSLIGWGGNQRWDESALGSWGESICYDPSQAQAECSITDVRPAMVNSMRGEGHEQWGWTNNVGGGDFFRLFNTAGDRLGHASMNANYLRYGPCLTEVTYSGSIGRNTGLRHSITASLARTDDVVRATYRLRLDVDQAFDFSRFAIFQHGADTYNFSQASSFALGNAAGLIHEWQSQPGGDAYHGEARQAIGKYPWVSLHDSQPSDNKGERKGAWANRGIVIREWNAKLGGKPARPWIAEHGTSQRNRNSSTIDVVPPPGIKRLEPGDFIEATIESIVMPQHAGDYYGPNSALREALQNNANRWHLSHREAVGNERRVEMKTGVLERTYPDLRIALKNDRASFTLNGGIGYVPITFTGLTSASGYLLSVDGQPLDQSVHGNDFWQSDYDPSTRTWTRTYNLPTTANAAHELQIIPDK